MDPKFNVESGFIKHTDKKHEKSVEKKEFDFEYQKEFREFILNTLRECNIEISNDFANNFDVATNIKLTETEARSVYLESSEYLKDMITLEDPEKRLDLDHKLENKFYSKFRRDILNQNFSQEELDKLVTKIFLEKVDLKKLISVMENEADVAKKNILLLIIQIIDREAIPKTDDEVEVKREMPGSSKLIAGTCANAEKNMMAFVSGKHMSEVGYTNLIVDAENNPVMLEKMFLGDSHSCVSLRPIRIDGVLIPAGAIFSAVSELGYKENGKKMDGAISYVRGIDQYKGFMFLRMSLFSLPEEIRASAGGSYYSRQQGKTYGYINYDWITPEVIYEHAKNTLESKGKNIE